MPAVLVVAATSRELGGRDGLACGVGPVEAAAATAAALARSTWSAVLQVGIAGSRGLPPGTWVIGSEAVYCDLEAAIPVVDSLLADARLVEAAQQALPTAVVMPIGTSAAVGGTATRVGVEAMEGFGVLRAAALAGVPAIEIRVVSNEIGEADRGRWKIAEAIDILSGELDALVSQVERAVSA